jgi:hypothetical protein
MDGQPSEEQGRRVELDELLAAEFNYIALTATQANEDRARVSSFYLIAVGSLVAALFSTQFFEPDRLTQAVRLMFSGLFILLTILGASTVLQLAQLRSAWHESMRAMNQIKDFAIKQNPEVAEAFLWKTSTIPRKYKRSSVSYYQALEVSIIGGLTFGAAMFFLQQAFLPVTAFTWLISLLLGALAVYIQMTLYKRMLA